MECVATHEVEPNPVLTPTTEVKNSLGGTQVENYALPAHDSVEMSGLGNLNAVMPLILSLEASLSRLEVMSLERFEMLAEEAAELKKNKREILARLIGIEGGLGEISNQATALENRVEGYQKPIQQILDPGRAQIVFKND